MGLSPDLEARFAATTATITKPTPVAPSAPRPWPTTIATTPATAIATGSHTRVAWSSIRVNVEA